MDLHGMIDELNEAQKRQVADFIASLLAEAEEQAEPEPEEAGDNGKVRGAGWIEHRMVSKWGPYEYHCWYGPDGRKQAKYRGKVHK